MDYIESDELMYKCMQLQGKAAPNACISHSLQRGIEA
jgi:hypothetical protein